MAAEPEAIRVAEVPATEGGGREGEFHQLNKQLRACRRCRLVKTEKQFRRGGCDNCTNFDPSEYTGEGMHQLTTSNFSGLATVIDPSSSWAAQWVHLDKVLPGAYAMHLPEDERMDAKGRRMR